jgi:predicted AAA+ superfamily ATPase
MINTQRYLENTIKEDAIADKKMAFISGPRQVGKTTLSKRLLQFKENYYTWDDPVFKRQWTKNPSYILDHIQKGPIVLDEIHKYRPWKSHLKGFYDMHGPLVPIIVTGSAKLDIYRRGSDSLMGRYIPYRLHPFSVAESENPISVDKLFQMKSKKISFEDLMNYSGFPEPLIKGNSNWALRWSKLRLDRLVFEDFKDLKAANDLNAVRLLTDLLPERVGSLLSLNSLREDCAVAYATMRSWVEILESLYYCFKIRPFTGKLSRSLRSDPKLYLFDPLQVENPSARLENIVALHLLKACHFWNDSAQGKFDLHFVATKEKKEVDFLVTMNNKPWMLVECKSNNKHPSANLVYFMERLKTPYNFQLVLNKNFEKEFKNQNIRIMDYENFLSYLV